MAGVHTLGMPGKSETKTPELTCLAHISNAVDEVKPFSETRWSSFLRSVNAWKELSGRAADIATFSDSHADLVHVDVVVGCTEHATNISLT